MAKKPIHKPKTPEAQVSGAGQYRATCAFAFNLDRIERGATITLTAEQAATLGKMVVLVAPQKAADEVSNDNQSEQADASDKDEQGGSSADDASGSEAANQDQTV